MNPEQYKKMMREHREAGQAKSPVSEVRDGDVTHKYFDARRYDRFGEPNYAKMGNTSSGAPVMNQPVTNGDDPLKLYLHKSRGKGEKTPNFHEIEQRLFQLPKYDPNFFPLHDILSNTHWSKQDQTRVLRQVLQYSVDVDRPIHGASVQTPLEKAFETNNPEAAMLFIGHGADLNKPNIKGYKAIHHAALNGMPELIPIIAQRAGTAGMTAAGHSVADLAMNHLKSQLEKPRDWLTQDAFETSLETYYKSLAAVRKFKLHDGPWDFSAHKEKLNALTASFPQYKPFIDTMEKKLDEIEPSERIPTYPPSAAYTNPGKGLNDPVLDNFEHAWLGFLSFMDKARENMQRSNIVDSSRNKVATCLRNMDQLTDPAAIEYLQKNRHKLNLDMVVEDPKLNPHGDTLLTRAIRDGKYDVAQQLLQLDVNMHATDGNGDTALHLLAKTCTDKEQFLTMVKQMVGIPGTPEAPKNPKEAPQEARRASLLGHGNLANWYVPDAQGNTFMDILRQQHPEWKPDPVTGKYPEDSWFNDIQQQLGIPVIDNSIPEWSIESVLRLGGPEEVLRLGKNPDPLLLTNRTLPTLEPLGAYATKDERDAQVTSLFQAVSKLQFLRQDSTSSEERQEIRKRLESIVESQDPETKMRALLLFTDKMDSLNAGQMEGQVAIMRSIAHDMKTGNAQEKERIFAPFHEKTIEAQANVVHFFEAQSLLQGPPEGMDEADQQRMASAIEDFRDAAQMLTKEMETYAGQKWGAAPDATNTIGETSANGNRMTDGVEDAQIKRFTPGQ